MKKFHVIMGVLLLFQLTMSSQNCSYTISGRVVDFHNGEPLYNAAIAYENQVAYTDSDGTYRIEGLCDTFYNFTVSHEDCNSQVVPIKIDGNKTYNFNLEHHLSELEEVKIKGSTSRETLTTSEETLTNIEKYGSASLGDALREIKGVSSLNTGATIVKPIIQGLSGSRVLILNNGVRMQDMEWGDEHAPNIDINSANTITVIKGASALKYGGDAIGGVIVVKPNRIPVKDTLYGKISLNAATNGRGGNLSSELNKGFENGFFLKAQGSVKRFGDFEAPDYILSNTGVFEKGLGLAFGMNKFVYGWDAYYSFYDTELAVLAASHIGNVNDLNASINGAEPDIIRDFTYDINSPRQEVTHHLGKLRFFKRFEELGKWTTQYDFQYNQRFEFDRRRTEELSKRPSIDLALITHSLTSDFDFDANTTYSFNIGILARYQKNIADALNTGVRRLIPDYNKYDAGIFISSEIDITEATRIDLGIRYDFNQIDAKKFYLESRWEEKRIRS